jgi:hypothetical protein
VSIAVLVLRKSRVSFSSRDIPPVPKGLHMKTLLSIVAASGLVLSTASAFAECGGHQSAKLNQVVASNDVAPVQQEVAASTYDPQTIKKPVESATETVTQQ